MTVRRTSLLALPRWRLIPDPLRLAHESLRFFSIVGGRCRQQSPSGWRIWDQPFIYQPEIGILGFLCKQANGWPQLLVQAKVEPGRAGVQLSPTVQATRSNYEQVHGGRKIPYLEFFLTPERKPPLLDALMPEHGAFFIDKHNRNMIVLVTDDVPEHHGFRWMSLVEILDLAMAGDLLHMDARSVLACAPMLASVIGQDDRDAEAVGVSSALARSLRYGADVETLEHWLDEVATETRTDLERLGLDALDGWALSPDLLVSAGGDAKVVGVSVRCQGREIAAWGQPLLRPKGGGILAMVCQRAEGVMRFLVAARVEPGHLGRALLGPTVVDYGERSVDEVGRQLLRKIQQAPSSWLRHSATHSEEGGRFLGFRNRYVLVELPADVELVIPPQHRWLTLGQIHALGRRGYVTIEARNILACAPYQDNRWR